MRRTSNISIVLALGAALQAMGCGAGSSGPTAVPPPEQRPLSQLLFEKGLSFAQSGQSTRAEQYLLAALDEGASWDEVFPHLVETCISSGRIRAALVHVRQGLLREPTEPRLHHLAASLHLALGQVEEAQLEVHFLAEVDSAPPEVLLFLGRFYDSVIFDPRRSRHFYEQFLFLYPGDPQAPWVEVELRRAERRGEWRGEWREGEWREADSTLELSARVGGDHE